MTPPAPTPTPVGALLARLGTGSRHGVVPPAQLVPSTRCDVEGVWHASVASPWGGTAGGVGWDPESAEAAAVGEALERYAAAVYPLPGRPPAECRPGRIVALERFALFSRAQRRRRRFPYGAVFAAHAAGGGTFTDVTDLHGGGQKWVPRFLVGLGDPEGAGMGSSSGLAAAPSRSLALLRAVQELVERDALMTTWNHGVVGRRVVLDDRHAALVAALEGEVVAIDATPAFSPHPVALVARRLPRRGRRRIGLGAACRATWSEAVDKAFLEWSQGVLFAGVVGEAKPASSYPSPSDVHTFEDHAAYYSVHPDTWDDVPLVAGDETAPAPLPPDDVPGSPVDQLDQLVPALGAAVGLMVRDLTTRDLAQVGMYVVRALSPDLTPIHCEHAWPFLGGRARDLRWRYPSAPPAARRAFPNPLPHPLG